MTHGNSRRRIHKQSDQISLEKSDTAPDYSVEEDQYGRLVNREKRMIWPERKPRSKTDFEAILDNVPDVIPVNSPAPSTCSYICHSFDSTSNFERYNQPDREVEATFIGGSSSTEAEARVQPSSFVLYYKIEEPFNNRVYLYMAYKNSENVAFHFPLTCRKTKDDDGSMLTYWRVEYGDSHPKEFPCLSALVRYYQVFSCYDIRKGRIEAFPMCTNHVDMLTEEGIDSHFSPTYAIGSNQKLAVSYHEENRYDEEDLNIDEPNKITDIFRYDGS